MLACGRLLPKERDALRGGARGGKIWSGSTSAFWSSQKSVLASRASRRASGSRERISASSASSISTRREGTPAGGGGGGRPRLMTAVTPRASKLPRASCTPPRKAVSVCGRSAAIDQRSQPETKEFSVRQAKLYQIRCIVQSDFVQSGIIIMCLTRMPRMSHLAANEQIRPYFRHGPTSETAPTQQRRI